MDEVDHDWRGYELPFQPEPDPQVEVGTPVCTSDGTPVAWVTKVFEDGRIEISGTKPTD